MHKASIAVIVFVAVVAAFALIGGSAIADPGNGNGAWLIKADSGLYCWVGLGGIYATTHQGVGVETPSGNFLLRCQFRPDQISIGSPPATAWSSEEFPCSVFGRMTYDSHFVISPAGNAIMTCEFRPTT